MENRKNLLELRKVTKKFDDRVILNEIDLKVNEGDLITIMGKSGAGKSTLLNILGFFEDISGGTYLFQQKKVKKYQTSQIRNRNIGFVFQSYNLIPCMTVFENIALPIYYSLVSSKVKNEYIRRIPELLKKYQIEHIKDQYVDLISGGEKQRVCLARALVCDAKLIISDEPTGNLDKNNSSIVLDEFVNLNRDGKTVIVVTHDEDVQRIATRRMILTEGKLFEDEI